MENLLTVKMTFPMDTPPEDIAARLRMQADLMVGVDAKTAAKRKPTPVQEEPIFEDPVEAQDDIEFDEDFAPKKKAAKKAAVDFDSDEAPDEATPKKAKAPTMDQVQAACKQHAKENSFDETKALLMKKFKTSSVTKLDPKQYAAVIALMQA